MSDLSAGMDAHAGTVDRLLARAAHDEEECLGDPPWPMHFRK